MTKLNGVKQCWMMGFVIILMLFLPISTAAETQDKSSVQETTKPQDERKAGGKTESELDQELERFKEIYELILQYHVENPASNVLIEGAIKGLITSLQDPHTTYLSQKQFDEFLKEIEGSFSGTGLQLQSSKDGIVIQGIVPGSSADKAGLLIGDILIQLDDKDLPLAGTLEFAKKKMIGTEGQSVKVTIKRSEAGKEVVKSYDLIYQKLIIPQVEAELFSQGIGYLKIYSFGDKTAEQVEQKLLKFQKENIHSLIVDLRGNPGGFLNSVLEVAKLFKESGIVVYVKNSSGHVTPLTIEKGQNFSLPIVLLVDQKSASAAEILAAFLKESVKAKVIGQKTYGKGTVQRFIPLDFGGVLKLSMEEYFTPLMNQVHNKGIAPDIQYSDSGVQLGKAVSLLSPANEIQVAPGGTIYFNGIKKAEYEWKALQKNEDVWIPIRLLSDWFEVKLEWNEKSKYVGMKIAGTKYAISKDKISLHEGRSYLSVRAMSALLPYQSELQDGTLVIRRK